MLGYSKELMQKFKKLVKIAYEEELNRHLNSLHEQFDEWKKNKITSLSLTNFIHKFHNGISKKLFRIYSNLDSSLLAARAIALDLIPKNELTTEITDLLKDKIEFYKHELDEDDEIIENEY